MRTADADVGDAVELLLLVLLLEQEPATIKTTQEQQMRQFRNMIGCILGTAEC
jgi:hypothetical protein